MCGIAGLWTSGGDGGRDARAMADALRHRGPDDAGVWVDADAGISLSHRRLSIIDLSSAGHQPMGSPSGRYVLSFNGEIYNHQDLRTALDQIGHRAWQGGSDTETLAHAIDQWGLDATLTRSVGMFALALWDRERRELILTRDRMGEKPLFYGWTGGRIAFASELKAMFALPGFERRVDPDVLALFLRHNYVPAPRSILRGVYKVEPGAIVTIARDALGRPPVAPPTADGAPVTGVSVRRYWSLDAVVRSPQDTAMSAEDAVDRLEARLHDAVALQLTADVPVGAFLSGGVDSSAIVALMARAAPSRVRSFTIGFAETGMDEAPYAKAVARHLGTEHHEMYVSAADALALVPDLPRIYDEPFADSSQIPTTLLSRFTRRSVTVALSGDGGDELFCGYNRHLVSRRFWDAAARVPAPLRHAVGRAITSVSPGRWDSLARGPLRGRVSMPGNKAHKLGRMLQTDVALADIYRAASQEWQGSPPVHGRDPLGDAAFALDGRTPEERMMHWDAAGYLPDDILVKVDRASMAASLETRVPFLDHRVVEQAWATPLAFKKRNGQGKWMLRQILYRHVPRELIERPKAGFAVPIAAWLRGPLADWAEDLLSQQALARQPALDAAAIRARWAQHRAGSHDWAASLWGVLMFQAWAAQWDVSC